MHLPRWRIQGVGLGVAECEVGVGAAEAGEAGGVGAKRRLAPDSHAPLAVEQTPLRLQHPRSGVTGLPHPPVPAEGEVRPPVHACGAREPSLQRLNGAGEAVRAQAGVGVEAPLTAEPGHERAVRAVWGQAQVKRADPEPPAACASRARRGGEGRSPSRSEHDEASLTWPAPVYPRPSPPLFPSPSGAGRSLRSLRSRALRRWGAERE